MVREIRIYVEGGGGNIQSRRLIRTGFGSLLRPVHDLARSLGIAWSIIPCGPRNDTFANFALALEVHPDAVNILLVDSESKVELPRPRWQHLRRQDRWDVPAMPEDYCHFMAQSVEAWLIADPDTLASYYGQGFRRGSLPRHKDVEAVAKDQLLKSLNRATAGTQKGRYEKIRHCADLLGLLNRDRVRQRARHCELLFSTLEGLIREAPEPR